MKKQNILDITMIALMTSIICIIAPFSVPIPFSIVPISCATFAVYLSAGILGAKSGVISVAIYILLGFVGVPVFAGWSAGAGVVLGPTGGYIFGFMIIAYFTGTFIKRCNNSIFYMAVGMIIGTIGCYGIGSVWLGLQLNLSIWQALMVGVIPYVLGDVIKMVFALFIIKSLRSYGYHRIIQM